MGWIDRIRRRPSRGYKPDDIDLRDSDFRDLGLTGTNSEVSLRRHCPDVYDQGSTNSCVAQAFAGGIETAERARGKGSTTPSRLFMYANSRLAHGAVRFDFGTHLRTCAKMLGRLGAPDEQYWPWSQNSLKINRRPSWVASMRAHPRMGGEYSRIYDTEEARGARIRESLRASLPVAFGTTVHKSFLASKGDSVFDLPDIDTDGARVGGHAMLIVGFADNVTHGPVYQVRNSWGPSWRDRGYCWLTAKYIESPITRDLWVLHGWSNVK